MVYLIIFSTIAAVIQSRKALPGLPNTSVLKSAAVRRIAKFHIWSHFHIRISGWSPTAGCHQLCGGGTLPGLHLLPAPPQQGWQQGAECLWSGLFLHVTCGPHCQTLACSRVLLSLMSMLQCVCSNKYCLHAVAEVLYKNYNMNNWQPI